MSTDGTHDPDVSSPSSLRPYASLNARLSRSCSCANSRNGSLQRTIAMMLSPSSLFGVLILCPYPPHLPALPAYLAPLRLRQLPRRARWSPASPADPYPAVAAASGTDARQPRATPGAAPQWPS